MIVSTYKSVYDVHKAVRLMNNIKQLRETLRMSQAELASILNVSQATVSKWDQGKALPDISTGIEMSRLFKVSLDVIYNNPHTPASVDYKVLTEAQQRALEVVDSIQSEPDQYEAIGVFRQTAEKLSSRSKNVRK